MRHFKIFFKNKIEFMLFQGSYVGTDCIIDVSKFKLFPLGDFYWKINHSYWQENRLIMCGVTSGQVISRPVT